MPAIASSPQRVQPVREVKGMLSLDTETTGKDLYHGCKPFFVTMWDGESDLPDYWEWEVDPYTRQPKVPKQDIEQIRTLLEIQGNWGNSFDDEVAERHTLILQNPKFDAKALETIGITNFPWKQVRCTLMAGHLLSSNTAHNLTDMVCTEIGTVDIEPFEKELERVVQECRRICRSKFPDWKIAKDGYKDMPSVKKSTGKDKEDKSWKADTWLPRALAIELGLEEDHPWWTVLSNYGNADSMVTFTLWKMMREKLIERGLWDIYIKTRIKLPHITNRMESRGLTCSKANIDKMSREYLEEAHEYGEICKNIAKSYNYNLVLPKGVSPNDSLKNFIFNTLRLEKTYKENAKTEKPTLDKNALSHYLHTLESDTKEHLFIQSLLDKRARDKVISDFVGYRRFWVPAVFDDKGKAIYYRLHPNMNPTGTDTLRWSCRNPNGQNIKKAGATEVDEMSIRAAFGPLPGREWWSCDGKNLERRIPAYKAKEEAIIYLLERPNDAPYFGSEHLMVAHMIFPKEFESCKDGSGRIDGRIFKKRYEPLYKRTKNGNFSIQYNAGRRKADNTFGVSGAFDMIKSRFYKQEALNQECIRFAERNGYIETIPDRTVDPKRGYPINCVREYGRVKPTLPFNYHIQGTACWWMMMCMIRVEERLEEWRSEGFDGHLIMQIHDELLFDFPKGEHPEHDSENSNLWRVQELRQLMEINGQNLVTPIPTPVSIEYHEHDWSEGVTCA